MTEAITATRVMIVDDVQANRMTLSALLTRSGYEVVDVGSGADCIRQLEIRIPDLLLIDVMMPGMSGTDLCQRVKSDPRFGDVAVVLISGAKVSPADQAYGLDLGADDYFSRPLDSKEFLARIGRILHQRNPGGTHRRMAPYSALDRRQTEGTAHAFGQGSLKETVPELFSSLCVDYGAILSTAIEQRFFKTEEDNSARIRMLSERLGSLKAHARDILDIHQAAIRSALGGSSALKDFHAKEEGRILLVEVMGHLVNYYRRFHIS